MQTCRHCGKENGDEIALCSECGLELGDSPLNRAAVQAWDRSRGLFRWRPASIILIIFAVIYWALALSELYMGRVFAHRGKMPTAHAFYWNWFCDMFVAILLVSGRQLIGRRTRVSLICGGFAVLVALLSLINEAVKGVFLGHIKFMALEVLLIWAPLIYVMIYAFRESRSDRIKGQINTTEAQDS